MANNPFLDESRDLRWYPDVPYFCKELRVPETLDILKDLVRPATMSLGTFVLRNTLHETILVLSVGDRYLDIIRLLVRIFGLPPDIMESDPTVVGNGDKRRVRGK